jgi:hypothetical protein
MLIYQAAPGRLYPSIINKITNKRKDALQFHYPFLLKNENDWLTKNNILFAIPETAKHIRTDKFLYGVFGNSHLNLQQDDFVFTIINHPVDQVYECFSYLKNVSKNIKTILQANQVEVLKQFTDVTIEEFVDLVLEDSEFYFEYLNIWYKPCKDAIYTFESFQHFNYVGKYNNLKNVFERLSEIFNEKIDEPEDKKDLSYDGNHYRRSDLETKFKDKIDCYNSI